MLLKEFLDNTISAKIEIKCWASPDEELLEEGIGLYLRHTTKNGDKTVLCISARAEAEQARFDGTIKIEPKVIVYI